MPNITRAYNVSAAALSAKQAVRAPAPAPEPLSAMQQTVGNQGMAELLGSGAPASLAVALSLQRAAGNRAVQRLYAAPHVTPAPAGTVQRLTEGEVKNSTELSVEEQKTFDEWLKEKHEVEEEYESARMPSGDGASSGEHTSAKKAAQGNVKTLLSKIEDIKELKAVLSRFKELHMGKSRGAPVKQTEVIDAIKTSGLAEHLDLSKFKRMEVLKWRDYQRTFRSTEKRIEKLEAISGFTHGGDVFIVEGSDTIFTALHEALHATSEEKLQRTYGFYFNEGVTEFITRQTTDQLALGSEAPEYRTYDAEVLAVKDLTKHAGVTYEELLRAYFKADVSPLAEKFTKKFGPDHSTKIAASKKLGETANELVRDAQPQKKKKGFTLTPEIMAQNLVEQIDEREMSLEQLEKSTDEGLLRLLPLVKKLLEERAAKANEPASN